MAQAAQTAPAQGQGEKKRRSRSPSPPRVAFLILQAVDNSGQPMQFSKSNLKVLSVETSAETVLEKVESGDTEGAFYLRVTVPPRVAQRQAPAQRPMPAAA